MNTKSLNNAISKETGLIKSTIIKGYAQVCNRSNVCYAYRRTYKYSGDFHCKKMYANNYKVIFDSNISEQKKKEIIKLLKRIGCVDVTTTEGYNSNIYFKTKEA